MMVRAPSEPQTETQDVLAALKAQRARGQLTIFFGAAAGVGKTYAMLEAAQAKRRDGTDVLAGLVETHGRQETDALLRGLEVLLPRLVEYRGARLKEFDLDGTLKRRPALVLVDELAHTNAEGSRHAKRWQDVEELLDQGIDVFTTLNVQHLESLNDVVAQITGVVVRETVPDSIFEQATEVKLIDLPTEELLKRLQEGKVYVAEQAELAVQRFFRTGNLTALRELALRVTADRVNAQLERHRQAQPTPGTWATTERVLVCISASHRSLHLIRATHRLARSLRAAWYAIYVETPSEVRLSDETRGVATKYLRLAEQLGAEVATLSGQSLVEEILAFARSKNITTIVVGDPHDPWWKRLMLGMPLDRLIRKSGDSHVHVIRTEPHRRERAPILPRERLPQWPGYRFALIVVAGTSLLNAGLFYVLRFQLANLAMLYLLAVVAVALWVGRGPSILAAILSVLAFDFLFVPPQFTFAVADTEYLLTFGVMLVVGLLISELTSRIRKQMELSRLRERRTASLYSLSQDLATSWGTDALLTTAVRHMSEVFECQVIALLPDAHGRLTVRAGWPKTFDIDAKEQSVAQWTFDVGQIAGKGTDTLPAAETLFLPMTATGQPVGALGVRPTYIQRLLIPEQLHLLEAFAHQTGLAVECDRLADTTRKAQAAVQTEKIRNAILSAIPHDLRTPLAAITGSASTLLDGAETLEVHARRDLADNIMRESQRLTAIFNNLLDLSKLESGTLKPKLEALPVDEAIGAALSRLEKALDKRPVQTTVPSSLPLVPMDGNLMEQVLVNLLDNAIKYTPAGTPIEITARVSGASLILEIADHGPGLSPEDIDHVFDKFYRGEQVGREGFGLGLPICRSIVELHGGQITAENRPGGGALFRVTLPLATPPGQAKALA